MAVVIGGGGSTNTPITINGAGSGYTWSSATNKSTSSSIKLEGADADIFVQGKSMDGKR